MIFITFLTSFQHKTRLVPKIIDIKVPENNFFNTKKRSTFTQTLNILTKIYMDFLCKSGLFSLYQRSPADRSYVIYVYIRPVTIYQSD